MYGEMIIKEAGKSSEPGEKKEEEGDVEDKSQVTQVRVQLQLFVIFGNLSFLSLTRPDLILTG